MHFGMHKARSVSVHACITNWPAGGRIHRIATPYARLAVARSTPRVSRFGVLICQGLPDKLYFRFNSPQLSVYHIAERHDLDHFWPT